MVLPRQVAVNARSFAPRSLNLSPRLAIADACRLCSFAGSLANVSTALDQRCSGSGASVKSHFEDFDCLFNLTELQQRIAKALEGDKLWAPLDDFAIGLRCLGERTLGHQ